MAENQTPTEASLLSTSPPAAIKDAASQIASIVGINGVNSNGSVKHEDETPLFSPTLLSAEVSSLLPEGYSMRPLQRADYHIGYLDTLRVLTTVGQPSYETYLERYNFIAAIPSTYFILVILDPSQTIVGTGAVIVERKFIHNMGLVGHIEDIAVAKNQQGKKLGLRIIHALDHVAKEVGCYKSILDCSEANEGFYVKCGFKRAGLEMAHYYELDGGKKVAEEVNPPTLVRDILK